MPNLESTYLGLKLKSPVIVGSSGLTTNVEKILDYAKYGAGAIVLKSLFEEQINVQANQIIENGMDYPEAGDYIKTYVKENSIDQYLKHIEKVKQASTIPVIASINCISGHDWARFAKQIEKAGADALELNVYLLPLDKNTPALEYEQQYFNVVESVLKEIKIPVAVKMSNQFTNPLFVINRLASMGVKGFVLFNRFYQPDFDIDKFEIVSSEIFSHPSDIRNTLRWVGIASDKIKNADFSASTGIHDGKAVIKMLLAGASSVQICSALYKNGPAYLERITNDVINWMKQNNYKSIDQFRGKLNIRNIQDPALYERSQFMKYYSSYE